MKYIFSGFEGKTRLNKLIEMVDNGFEIDGILVSYLNFHESDIPLLRRLKQSGTVIMLDSGAHSFIYWYLKEVLKQKTEMGHAVSQKVRDIAENNLYDAYVDDLIQFVQRYNDLFDIYVELDIQLIVGDSRIEKWREKWAKQGLTPMYVWHGEKKDKIEKWLKRTNKIGVGGTGKEKDMSKRIAICKTIRKLSKDSWIHTFAMGGAEVMKKTIKYASSTDTTDWIGSKFGQVVVYKGNKISMAGKEDKSSIRKTMSKNKKLLKKYGISLDIKNLNYSEMNYMNLITIQQYIRKISKRPPLSPDPFPPKNTLDYSKPQDSLDFHKERDSKGRFTPNKKPKNPLDSENKTDLGIDKNKVIVVNKRGRVQDCTKSRMNALKTGLYAETLRGLICDNCPIREQVGGEDGCPYFQEGALCHFETGWRKFGRIRDKKGLLKKIESLIANNDYRLKRALSFEDAEGGSLDKTITDLMDKQAKLLDTYDKIKEGRKDVEVNNEMKVLNVNVNKLEDTYAKLLQRKRAKLKERLR